MMTTLKYDAVLLAGTHRNQHRLINGVNKAFLNFNDKSMVQHTVSQLLECPRLNRVIVVGPREKLERELEYLKVSDAGFERLTIIQQRSRLLENVWIGFLATFPDGNHLPVNHQIDKLLLGGHLPIRKKFHLYIIKSVYAAIAGMMRREDVDEYSVNRIKNIIEGSFNDFRQRFERAEWFMGRINFDLLVADGHILKVTDDMISFQNKAKFEYFSEWEKRQNKKIFVTASDLPLLTPIAVTDFITRCEEFDDDFFFSVSREEDLKPYYRGVDNTPGIIRPYINLREARVRAANLILVKPNKIGNKEVIQESFGIRKMTEWGNIIKMMWKLIRQKHRYQTIRLAVLLQLIAVLNRNGHQRIGDWFRHRTRGRLLEIAFSHLLMTRLKMIITPYGGVSLDVDTVEDYELIKKNWRYWKEIQEKYVSEHQSDVVQLFLSES